ncbi:MAG: hypothetical protein NZM35_01125 [Chitinophagales bacterium]|nr:hypothetical protein [Chitinophagales bacterium]MDW8418091.1 hypothetical protein [Chitinophagales bacterium]
MLPTGIISNTVKPLQVTDSGEAALLRMQEYNLTHLPVNEGVTYAGLVSIEELMHVKKLQRPLREIFTKLSQPKVLNTAHIFDVMKAAIDWNVKVVPVVNEEHEYLGWITAESCMRAFTIANSILEPGCILELQSEKKDYQLSDIARIAEENNTEIQCFYVSRHPHNSLVNITLKLSRTDVSAIVASLERYNYEIINVYNDVEYSGDLREHYEALMRYLNV